MAVTLTNSAEGITPSGTTLTAGSGGNSGGSSGSFFDVVTIGSGATVASDSTHAMHGSLGIKTQTGATAATAYFGWTTSLGGSSVTQSWFRFYLYITAIQSSGNFRLASCLNASNAISGAVVLRPTTGLISMQNSSNAVITGMTTTNAVPLNQWVRVEGYFNSATGQGEIKLFLTPDSATPTETITSATGQALGTDVSSYRFGQGGGNTANYGPFWFDDVGASDTAYLGPAVTTVSGTASPSFTATVSAAGSVTFLGSATASTTATVAAAGSVTKLGSASLTGTATVSAAGSVAAILSGTASRAVTAAVSAAGGLVLGADASQVAVAATISADSTQVQLGQAECDVNATIRANGSIGGVTYNRTYPRSYMWSYVNYSAGSLLRATTATITAAGAIIAFQSATQVALNATVSAAGTVALAGSASRAVTATVSAAGAVTPVLSGSASLPVTAIINAAGSVTFLGTASRAVTATISAGGAVGTGGLATANWAASVTAAGSLIVGSGASQAVTATISAAGSGTFLSGASRAVTATISAAGAVVQIFGSGASLTATAFVGASGLVAGLITAPAAPLSLTAAVSATGYASGGAFVITGGAMPWTFWADNAVSPFTDIGPVQVVAFTANWVLSGFGSGEATIAVSPNSSLTRAALMQLWTWRLWAFYQGQPVWCGCPTGVTDVGSLTVTVSLSELPGYLALKQYALNHTYTGVEQCTIASDLASPLANIGVPVVTQPGSGVNRDRTYTFLQSTRDQLLTELSQVINGPEFRSEYSNPANPACTLKIAYPRVGVASGLAVIVPHGAISFRASWASDMMRTRTFAVGDVAPNAPTTATKPVVTIVAPQAGVPELDHVDDWPGVSVTATLNEYASAYSQSYASPALALEAVMPLMSPPLGSYNVGDDVSVVLADPLVPSGLNATGRLTAISLDAGSGTATWTVTIALPRPRRYATLAAQLKALHRKTAAIFHTNMSAPPGGINP